MKFVNVWKDNRPERGEDIEEEEVLEETEDREADVAEVSRPCEGSFICADEWEVLRLLKDAAGSAA